MLNFLPNLSTTRGITVDTMSKEKKQNPIKGQE